MQSGVTVAVGYGWYRKWHVQVLQDTDTAGSGHRPKAHGQNHPHSRDHASGYAPLFSPSHFLSADAAISSCVSCQVLISLASAKVSAQLEVWKTGSIWTLQRSNYKSWWRIWLNQVSTLWPPNYMTVSSILRMEYCSKVFSAGFIKCSISLPLVYPLIYAYPAVVKAV